MHITLNFHSDPSHGWLEVPKLTLRDLGLYPKSFSRYSYQNLNNLFLEEDCDMPKAVKALQDFGYVISFNERNYNSDAPIRNYRGAHN